VATLEQLENAKTGLDIASQQVKTAEFNLNYSQIRASKDGFVLKKFANPGQLIGPGAPVVQVNGNGARNNSWVLQTTVTDQQWGQLAIGDSASIVSANEPTAISGKVVRKSQAADPLTGTYWVEVSPDQSTTLQLAAGMFGKATLYPTLRTEGWQIPYEALLDAQGKVGYVFVTSDGKIAKKVRINLGQISEKSVQVLSGLENHSHLIVSGSAYLSDGSTIEINNK
jgi:RND family efflux transporter MFP subunit